MTSHLIQFDLPLCYVISYLEVTIYLLQLICTWLPAYMSMHIYLHPRMCQADMYGCMYIVVQKYAGLQAYLALYKHVDIREFFSQSELK